MEGTPAPAGLVNRQVRSRRPQLPGNETGVAERSAEQIKKLKEEHAAILVLLQAIIEKAAGPGSNKANRLSHALAAQVERLVAKVRRHEAEENELMMAAHWNTLGTSD